MNLCSTDVIVIGAGHAGLSISYQLDKLHFNHIVFEKGKIGDSWRNQRWDSFKLNTPNKLNLLPGRDDSQTDSDGFSSAADFVSFLENYSRSYQLPVAENTKVLYVERIPDSKDFLVCVSQDDTLNFYKSKHIVVASGGQNKKIIPSFAEKLSPGILQLHTCEYRNVSQLPDGAVLVVGSAQSGIQIAEDLIAAGRKVFISTSQVARVPRRYRGKDITDWYSITGFFDVCTKDISDPETLLSKQPQISNTGLRGRTISYQSLSRNGAVILGKVKSADEVTVFLQPDAAAHVRFADEISKKIKNMINEYIAKSGIDAPPPERDPDDDSDPFAACASTITELNLRGCNITTVIWTTGFAGDFSYLRLPVLDDHGMPKHYDGISDIEGLYFLGLPWLRKRKSGIITGISEDSEFIARRIVEHTQKAA